MPKTRKKVEISPELVKEGLFQFTKEPREGVCPVRYCTNPSGSKTVSGLCSKHNMRRWRKGDPRRAAFSTLRDHAKGRRIKFDLSFEYFCGLTDAYCFYDPEAEDRGDYPSLDRIDATKGYERGNLRVVSISDNSIKGNKERYLPEHVRSMLERKRIAEDDPSTWVCEDPEYSPDLEDDIDPDNCPF